MFTYFEDYSITDKYTFNDEELKIIAKKYNKYLSKHKIKHNGLFFRDFLCEENIINNRLNMDLDDDNSDEFYDEIRKIQKSQNF